ncbi:MAG TPA: hypothetical protein VLK28_10925 [Methylomirabilota bacterium]|nr:hypothetical protein [Methylomirabilota bacterium]
MRGEVPGWLWLAAAIGGLAAAAGLARSRIEEAAVAIVGLVVFALVLVSVLSQVLPRRSARPGGAPTARAIDAPLALLLLAAFIAFCGSVVMWFLVDRSHGIFVGLWVPSVLSIAILTLLIWRAHRSR